MQNRAAALLALLALLVPGCVEDSGSLGAPGVDGEPAGSSAGHGDPGVANGAVSVRRTNDGRHTASQTVSITNDFGGASQGVLRLETVNGAVAVGPGSASSYRATVQLSATANTEAQAREALATLSVDSSERRSGRLMEIGIEVEFGRYEARDTSRSGSITLTVPPGPAYSIEAATVNGGIRFADLRGDAFEADTVNGGIEVDGVRGRSLSASSASGGVRTQGEFDEVDAETTNGGIEADLRPGRSGSYRFDTVNGGIEVSLDRSGGRGYDVRAETVNGAIEVEVSGAEPVGAQGRNSRHVRTAGYEDAGIRTEVAAETVNGGIEVTG